MVPHGLGTEGPSIGDMALSRLVVPHGWGREGPCIGDMADAWRRERPSIGVMVVSR